MQRREFTAMVVLSPLVGGTRLEFREQKPEYNHNEEQYTVDQFAIEVFRKAMEGTGCPILSHDEYSKKLLAGYGKTVRAQRVVTPRFVKDMDEPCVPLLPSTNSAGTHSTMGPMLRYAALPPQASYMGWRPTGAPDETLVSFKEFFPTFLTRLVEDMANEVKFRLKGLKDGVFAVSVPVVDLTVKGPMCEVFAYTNCLLNN